MRHWWRAFEVQGGHQSPIDKATRAGSPARQRPDSAPGGPSAGDTLPGVCEIIEVRVSELWQLFNEIDPSPFHERDLDPKAEALIVSWGRSLPRHVPLALMVHLDRGAGVADEAAFLRDAIHEFFARRATEARRRIRELFHRGRLSLLIAIAFLALALTIGERVASYFPENRLALLVQEGVLIVGWVAMWRPVEIFLYDWWPIRTDIRLFERLSSMPVRIEYRDAAPADAWRTDWPVVPAAARRRSEGEVPRSP